MFRLSTLILAAGLLSTAPAAAADQQGDFAVHGAGSQSCQQYLDAMNPVCQGANAAPGAYLPMLDYLLEEHDDGTFTDFGYVPMTVCEDGEERLVELWGETVVTPVDGALALDFDLYDEEGVQRLLSGGLDVRICP